MATSRLDRTLVARTALDLLNEVGLEGLSLRAIANELNVKAPALYWHFKDKQALLDEMATEIMRRMTADVAPAPAGWREAITSAMRGMRGHLLRYRDGAKVYSGTRFTDTSYAASMDANLRFLGEAGFPPAAAARAWNTAYSYTIGFVIEEQAMSQSREGEDDGYDLDARAERLARFPVAAAAGYEIFGHQEEGFEAGLGAVVAGIGVTLLPPAAREP